MLVRLGVRTAVYTASLLGYTLAMAFHVRDPETDRLVREYAAARGMGLTEAIRSAVELAAERRRQDVEERRRAIQEIADEVASWPRTGLKADKAFYDSLNDE